MKKTKNAEVSKSFLKMATEMAEVIRQWPDEISPLEWSMTRKVQTMPVADKRTFPYLSHEPTGMNIEIYVGNAK